MNDTSIDAPHSADVQPANDQASPSPPQVPDRGVLLAVTLFVSFLVVCDAAIGPLTEWARPTDWTAFLVYTVMGCFLSQLGLLAAWNVWGPLAYWRRMVIGWGFATLLYAVLLVGVFLSSWLEDGGLSVEDAHPILAWPLLSIFLEAPLWAMRTFFGARFVRSGAPSDRPLAISDLLTGMVVAGVALALARLGRPQFAVESRLGFWGILVAAGALGAVITGTGLPLLALTATRIRSWTASLTITMLTVLAVGVGPPAAAYFTLGMPPSRGFSGLITMFLALAFAAAPIAAAFGIARLAGYRFQFGRSSSAQSSEPQENR